MFAKALGAPAAFRNAMRPSIRRKELWTQVTTPYIDFGDDSAAGWLQTFMHTIAYYSTLCTVRSHVSEGRAGEPEGVAEDCIPKYLLGVLQAPCGTRFPGPALHQSTTSTKVQLPNSSRHLNKCRSGSPAVHKNPQSLKGPRRRGFGLLLCLMQHWQDQRSIVYLEISIKAFRHVPAAKSLHAHGRELFPPRARSPGPELVSEGTEKLKAFHQVTTNP